jgi:hypothetical protein
MEALKNIIEERLKKYKCRRAIVTFYNGKVIVRFGRKVYKFEGTINDAREVTHFLKEKGYAVVSYLEASPTIGWSSTKGYYVSEEERYFAELKRVNFSEWSPRK